MLCADLMLRVEGWALYHHVQYADKGSMIFCGYIHSVVCCSSQGTHMLGF